MFTWSRLSRRIPATVQAQCDLLQERFEANIAGSPDPASLVDARHEAIVRTLHRFVYSSKPQHLRQSVQLSYGDASRSEPFPIGCLTQADANTLTQEPPLRLSIGLMSFRHGAEGLDYLVDFYALRNQELSGRFKTAAAAEKAAYQKTLMILGDEIPAGGASLQIFHTGFQPAIVGFYRAVVEIIKQRQKIEMANLIVSSKVFRGRKLREGARCTPDAPSASRDRFRTILHWC